MGSLRHSHGLSDAPVAMVHLFPPPLRRVTSKSLLVPSVELKPSCVAGLADCIRQLLKAKQHVLLPGPAEVDKRLAAGALDTCNRLGLYKAASSGQSHAVRAVLEAGANASTADALGNTALHIASRTGQSNVVSALLRAAPADPQLSAVNSTGSTALHEAAQAGHEEIVLVLLARGSHPNVKDYQGRTPLLCAASEYCLSALIGGGAYVCDMDDAGQSILHIAAGTGNASLLHAALGYAQVRRLVNGTESSHSYTPLHAAAAWGHLDCVALLVAAGADKSAVTESGHTAAALSAAYGHGPCLAVLAAAEAACGRQRDVAQRIIGPCNASSVGGAGSWRRRCASLDVTDGYGEALWPEHCNGAVSRDTMPVCTMPDLGLARSALYKRRLFTTSSSLSTSTLSTIGSVHGFSGSMGLELSGTGSPSCSESETDSDGSARVHPRSQLSVRGGYEPSDDSCGSASDCASAVSGAGVLRGSLAQFTAGALTTTTTQGYFRLPRGSRDRSRPGFSHSGTGRSLGVGRARTSGHASATVHPALDLTTGYRPITPLADYRAPGASWGSGTGVSFDQFVSGTYRFDYLGAARAYRAHQPYRDAAWGHGAVHCCVCRGAASAAATAARQDHYRCGQRGRDATATAPPGFVTHALLPCEHAAVCAACMVSQGIGPTPQSRLEFVALGTDRYHTEVITRSGGRDGCAAVRSDRCPLCETQILAVVPIGRLADPAATAAVASARGDMGGGGAASPDARFRVLFARSARQLRSWVSKWQSLGNWAGPPTQSLLGAAEWDKE